MSINTNYRYCLPGDKVFFEYLQEKTGERKTKIEAYCDLMVKASTRYVSPFLKSRVEKPDDNQCHVTLSELAVEWKWHRVTVRAFLDKLEELGQISREKLPKSVIIGIPRAAVGNINQIGSIEDAFVQALVPELYKWETGNYTDEMVTAAVEYRLRQFSEMLEKQLKAEPGEVIWAFGPNAGTGIGEDSKQGKEILSRLALSLVASSAIRRALCNHAKDGTAALEAFCKEELGGEWGGVIEASKILADLVVDGKAQGLETQSEITRTEFLSLRSSFKALVGQLELRKGQF